MPPRAFPIHGVPEDELFTGNDGVVRPYGMHGVDSPFASKPRKHAPETGSFGKSNRRSRSKSGTPAVKREDSNFIAADKIFPAYLAEQDALRMQNPGRKTKLTSLNSQPSTSTSTDLVVIDGSDEGTKRYVHKEPTEVILRGYKSSQQYAAINQYERIAGRICEDYPRDAPIEQRKFKGDQRDPAVLRKKPLTVEEKAKAFRFAGGENWIKITFESAEAAEIATEASPQTILGHLVYAELYRGVPPSADDAIPATGGSGTPRRSHISRGSMSHSQSAPNIFELSPPASQSSTQTLDTATISHASSSTATLRHNTSDSQAYCRAIPTAKRIQLLPAEQALLPQQSYSQRILSNIPILGWLSSDIIGSQVPKTEQGEFDWAQASLYWRLMWWIDRITGWLDILSEKED